MFTFKKKTRPAVLAIICVFLFAFIWMQISKERAADRAQADREAFLKGPKVKGEILEIKPASGSKEAAVLYELVVAKWKDPTGKTHTGEMLVGKDTIAEESLYEGLKVVFSLHPDDFSRARYFARTSPYE